MVDLGFAPGSWSQVAISKVSPNSEGGDDGEGDVDVGAGGKKVGRVIGIDILPVMPPRGVSTIQGNFLSERVREEVRRYVADEGMGRVKSRRPAAASQEHGNEILGVEEEREGESYIDMERHSDLDLHLHPEPAVQTSSAPPAPIQETTSTSTKKAPAQTKSTSKKQTQRERDTAAGRTVDLLLSDMCAPWPQTTSLHSASITSAYTRSLLLWQNHTRASSSKSNNPSDEKEKIADAEGDRMANTTGTSSRDHFASMDLCLSALEFAFDTLRTGGGFVCKFFDGGESKELEGRMKVLFEKVVREKPEGSRGESREAYFVCLRRRGDAGREDVLGERS